MFKMYYIFYIFTVNMCTKIQQKLIQFAQWAICACMLTYKSFTWSKNYTVGRWSISFNKYIIILISNRTQKDNYVRLLLFNLLVVYGILSRITRWPCRIICRGYVRIISRITRWPCRIICRGNVRIISLITR